MKKIALIGASGFIGSAILEEALTRGHAVTAVVRDAKKIKIENENLKVVELDVFDTEKLTEVFKSTEEVISAYNPGWTNPNIVEDTTKGYLSIIAAAKKANSKRLLIVGGAGSLFVSPGVRVMDTNALPPEFIPPVKALANIYLDNLTNEKDLSWVFFSPAGEIAPGERTGKFRLGLDNLVVDAEGKSKISSADYAIAMVNELENPQHINKRFTIGY